MSKSVRKRCRKMWIWRTRKVCHHLYLFILGPADPRIAVAVGSDGMYLTNVIFEPFDYPRPNPWIEQVEVMHSLKQLLIGIQEPIQDIARIVENINKTVDSKSFFHAPTGGTLGSCRLRDLPSGRILPDGSCYQLSPNIMSTCVLT